MKSIKEYLLEEKNDGGFPEFDPDDLPNIFYHATIKPYLKNIKKYGLGGKIPKIRFWDYEDTKYEKIKQGFFVDIDPEAAYSYIDASDEIYDNFGDDVEIIVFSIKKKDLDLSKLSIDQNDESNYYEYWEDNNMEYDYKGPHSFFYDGVIPFEKLTQEDTKEY